jgi:hypothetical protein
MLITTADENSPMPRTLRFVAVVFSIAMAFAEVMIGLQNGLLTKPLQTYNLKPCANANAFLEKFSAHSRYYGGAAKLFSTYSGVCEIFFHRKAAIDTIRRVLA